MLELDHMALVPSEQSVDKARHGSPSVWLLLQEFLSAEAKDSHYLFASRDVSFCNVCPISLITNMMRFMDDNAEVAT